MVRTLAVARPKGVNWVLRAEPFQDWWVSCQASTPWCTTHTSTQRREKWIAFTLDRDKQNTRYTEIQKKSLLREREFTWGYGRFESPSQGKTACVLVLSSLCDLLESTDLVPLANRHAPKPGNSHTVNEEKFFTTPGVLGRQREITIKLIIDCAIALRRVEADSYSNYLQSSITHTHYHHARNYRRRTMCPTPGATHRLCRQ